MNDNRRDVVKRKYHLCVTDKCGKSIIAGYNFAFIFMRVDCTMYL